MNFPQQLVHYSLSGAALATALAWSNTARETISYVFPAPKEGLWAEFTYSLVITLLFIFLIWLLPRLVHFTDPLLAEII